MKLSKAQQAVVQKMRDGAELRLSDLGEAYIMLKHVRCINVRLQTFHSMRRNRIIQMCGTYINGFIYSLTEHYKNKQNMKLSEAQQAVVDKMREGYLIRKGVFIGLVKDGHLWGNIQPSTFNYLHENAIVEYFNGQYPFTYYQLTEQYKNEQK